MVRATYDMLDLKTKCCRRPRATFYLQVQHIICCPNPQSIIVLLYLHWIRITYSIKTIHKQTDHDQTVLNLDELIWDELALVWINSYTITPVHVIQIATNKLTHNLGRIGFEQSGFRTNRFACDVKRVIAWRKCDVTGPTYVFICPRANIDYFYDRCLEHLFFYDFFSIEII